MSINENKVFDRCEISLNKFYYDELNNYDKL